MQTILARTLDAAKTAYLDLRDVYDHMPSLVITALGLSFAAKLVFFMLPTFGLWFLALLFGLAAGIANVFLLTPYLIAVHRFIILGEVTSRYDLAPGDLRFQRFLGLSIAFLALILALALVLGVLPLPGLIRVVAMLALWIAVLIGGLRLIVLWPAVAVDSQRATWQNAMADTDGYALRIFLIVVAANLPVVIVSAVLHAIFGASGFFLFAVIWLLIESVISVVSTSLMVVIASRVYQWLGNRVTA